MLDPMPNDVEEKIHELVTAIRDHHDKDLDEAVERLLEWKPERTPVELKEVEYSGQYSYVVESGRMDRERAEELLEGDADCPFFSERYLYNLLGKDDARTLLALMRPLWAAAGIPRERQP